MRKHSSLAICLAALAVAGVVVIGCGGSDSTTTGSFAYAGTITGVWQGTMQAGPFTLTISEDGTATGTVQYDKLDGGIINGMVDNDGNLTATATAAIDDAIMIGTIETSGGHASGGTGTWSERTFAMSGTWTSP